MGEDTQSVGRIASSTLLAWEKQLPELFANMKAAGWRWAGLWEKRWRKGQGLRMKTPRPWDQPSFDSWLCPGHENQGLLLNPWEPPFPHVGVIYTLQRCCEERWRPSVQLGGTSSHLMQWWPWMRTAVWEMQEWGFRVGEEGWTHEVWRSDSAGASRGSGRKGTDSFLPPCTPLSPASFWCGVSKAWFPHLDVTLTVTISLWRWEIVKGSQLPRRCRWTLWTSMMKSLASPGRPGAVRLCGSQTQLS